MQSNIAKRRHSRNEICRQFNSNRLISHAIAADNDVKLNGETHKRQLSLSSLDTNFKSNVKFDCINQKPKHYPSDISSEKANEASTNVTCPLFRHFDKQLKVWEKHVIKHRLSKHLVIQQRVKAVIEARKASVEQSHRQDIFNICGEFGVSLFMPIDVVFDVVLDYGIDPHIQKCMVEKREKGLEENEVYQEPVILDQESHDVLVDSPRLIPLSTMQKIHNKLPETVQHRSWNRIYSISRDGDSFHAFLAKVKGHSNTVLLIKTKKNTIFGGFASCCWERPQGGNGASFYGNGASFVFTIVPLDTKDMIDSSCPEHNVTCHKWSGANKYVQMCCVLDRKIAMGGGGDEGSFGFCLEDYFSRGSAGSCETFNNPPLSGERCFDIVDFEVYGLSRFVC